VTVAPARKTLRDLRDDRSGASAIVVGLVMVTAMGCVGLGTDIGAWYAARREAQNAADSAAYSAAVAAMSGAGDATAQANAVAAGYGLRNGVDSVKVTVSTLTGTGPDRYEVVIERPARRFFSGLITSKATSAIRARAVASTGRAGDGCVLALNPSAAQSVLANGSSDLNLAGCSLYVNADNTAGLSLNGSVNIKASSVELVGDGWSRNGSSSIAATGGIHMGQKPASDPYANVAIPLPSGCAPWPTMNSGSFTIEPSADGTPKTFCNGDYNINGNVSVTFKRGIYVFDRGRLNINGGAKVRGEGVTLVFTSSTGSNYASMTLNGNADVVLSAPASGPTAGILFFQHRNASASSEVIFNGSSGQVLSGALYFPSQRVRINGGAAISTGGCTQLIADTIVINGNAKLGIDCAGTGVKSIGDRMTVLVE
jgi:hypothetical protein